MKNGILLAGFFICGMLAAGATAQMSPTTDTNANSASPNTNAAPSGLTAGDRVFVRKAAEGGMAEVELGKLAAEKGSTDGVKKFGQRMVDDHTKANDQFKQIAASKNVLLPGGLNARDKTTKARLEKLSGKQFDRAYMDDMVKDHIKDVAEFNRESKLAKDPDVKNFASQTLLTLRDHLKNARSVASETGSQASANSISK